MTHTGLFRIYFNRHQAAPLVWCVAAMVCEDTDRELYTAWLVASDVSLSRELDVPLDVEWEIAVQSVILRAATRTVYAPKPTPDADDGKPSAYLEAFGRLEIECGVATIYEHEFT